MLNKRDYYPFKYKLSICMSLLVLILVTFLGCFQYLNMSKILTKEFKNEQDILQQSVMNSMKDADTVYYTMEKDIETKMKSISQNILSDYEKMPDPAALNLNKYSVNENGYKWVDIYLVDAENVIRYSTDPRELNLDFKKYIEFSKFLDDTRAKGSFVSDRMGLSIINKDIKKFSYIPTKDRKYIVEIGVNMDSFADRLKSMNLDCESISQKIIGINDSLNDFILYNYMGTAYTHKDENGNPRTVSPEHRKYMEQAIATGKSVDFVGSYKGEKAYYRYVPYKKMHSLNSKSTDIIEIIYNDKALMANLNTNKNMVVGTILLALGVAVFFGIFISSFVSKPIDIIADAIEKISNGDFNQRTSPQIKSKDEFRILSKGFDDMMESISQLLAESDSKTKALTEKNDEIIKQKEEINALYEETTAMNEELYHLLDEVKENYLCTVRTLANSLEAKDKYTKGHCERVTNYSVQIAKAMSLEAEDIANIEFAGLLHDIGKIGISNDIINKEGALTDEEYRVLKKHPEIGFEILKDVGFLEVSKNILLQHHERVDGRGYPYGLKNDNIDKLAKILAVADSYDAMTSSRPYRKAALTTEQAIDQLLKNKGTQFDCEVVDVFIKLLESEEVKEAI